MNRFRGRWVVGLTGGIGSGKSTVLALIRRTGVPVADADRLAREALAPRGAVYRPVLKLFGSGVRKADGTLDRAAMAVRVFRNPRLRKRLETLLHPLVRRAIFQRVRRLRRGVFVADVPLLFEAGWRRSFDETVVVWCPRAERLRRLLRGGRFSRAEALRRMRAQMPLERKRRLADAIIDNGGSRRDTAGQVRSLREKWRKKAENTA